MKLLINTILLLFLSGNLGYSQTLEDYFKIAAQNNPGLQARYKAFEASLEKVPQVSSLPDPTFSFGYFLSPIETRIGPQQARFSLSQMFPWFGTLKARKNEASLLAQAKYQAFLDARNKLYYQVSAAYYPLYELKKWQRIEQENIEILESFKTIAQAKFESSNGTMVDILRVDIVLKDAQTELNILNDKKKPLLTTFNTLLNRSENKKVLISDSLANSILPDNSPNDSLLSANPALHALDLKIKASEASERVAHRQGLPEFALGLDYVMVGKRSDADVSDNGRNALMPMVSVSIPIFRSKYKAAVKQAQLMQESFSLQREDYANTLSSQYEMAWFQLQRQSDLISLYEEQILESNQALNLLFSAYRNSGQDFEEVLRMQQQLLKYEKMKATAQVQYHIALSKLNYLTAKTY